MVLNLRNALRTSRTLIQIVAIGLALISGCSQATTPIPTSSSNGPGASCSQVQGRILDVAEIRQLGTNWCWAASGEMVMSYFHRQAPQCEQVNNLYGMTQCCETVLEPECDKTGWPAFGHYNLGYQKTHEKELSWQQIKEQVACKGNPIAFSWRWEGGSGHMMVIRGFETVDGVNYVLVNDPNRNPQYKIIRYDYYVKSDGNHKHWDDFYDFTSEGGN